MRRLFWPLLFGVLGTVVLVSLGTWQVQRMAWKEGVISEINARIASDPVALPAEIDPEQDKYLPVVATGTITEDEIHLLASTRDVGAVYRLVSAFETDGGRRIMIDRGWIKTEDKDAARPAHKAEVIGNLHWPEERDSFTPENDVVGNIWFARDVDQMAEVLNAEPVLVIVREDSDKDAFATPLPVDSAAIPNDHLEYVITWYGLAIVWVAMTLYYLRRMRKTKKGLRDVKYISTRGNAPELSFEEAMLTGLARDGGLYVPESIPTLSADEIAGLAGKSYEEAAFTVMRPFVGDAFTDEEFKGIIARAYASFRHDARAPLVQLASNHYLLELFHGPTLAFKDFAMQLIGQLFQFSLARRNERVTIVGATSGDTGSAAIEAFRGLDNVDVFILFPHGRVSDIQRKQMTTPEDANVHALALDGDFDDCQARLKDMFNDFDFRDGVKLAGVNSINWARVLAQVVYYFTSAVSLGAPHRKVSFTVPTGNFGDIFAGYIAKKMGLPIERLVIATNQNDILHRTMETGAYTKEGVTPSISPSMDIQVSSNFERALFDAYGRDGGAVAQLMEELKDGSFAVSQGAMETLREHFDSGRASEDETKATISSEFTACGEVLCPHSAVGVKVGNAYLGEVPMVTLATAHPAKFPDAVEAAMGARPALPPHMADMMDKDERVTRVPNDLGALEALIKERIAQR